MRHMDRVLSAVLAAAAVLTLAGCGGGGTPAPASSPSAASSAASSAAASGSAGTAADGENTVYSCGGVQIALPTKYLGQLFITTDFSGEDASGGTTLLSVSEKASREAMKADYGEEGGGFLFSISRLTQAQFEQVVPNDCGGENVFAVSGQHADDHLTLPTADAYYVCTLPTDVQFYRSGGKIDTNSQDWKDWETLCGLSDTVCADMTSRNGLTAYTNSDFFGPDFTYTGDHVYLKYYSYGSRDGSTAIYDTLVLSQPAKHGEGGVWCVERWYDEHGTRSLCYPGTDRTGGAGVTAEEYYQKLQTACDGGSAAEQALLTPLGAAKDFVTNSGWISDPKVTDACFASCSGTDQAYFDLNNDAQQLVLELSSGQSVEDGKLLDLAERFTPDTWGVLGRGLYGSDWWTPLGKALRAAAVGNDGQSGRDAAMMHLFLSYTGDTAAIREDLAKALLSQQKADQAVFADCLRSLSAAEQARVQSAVKAAA